jgi:hypothetical protein
VNQGTESRALLTRLGRAVHVAGDAAIGFLIGRLFHTAGA